eukprot:CAMPEP_0183355000 /NCGR_PEP_ID=MMETSP0164_2-20130417/38775_1 /TAXON_ID=221442 /ORGANISM="Coccolithus pelagicus ssp braarudi, Strain PLY182g" /LENGTH=177 /DNA_ID=CAMNT_0025527991 /DNA_START=17 /DNA_END=550 /DNA_ORIENTATION=+
MELGLNSRLGSASSHRCQALSSRTYTPRSEARTLSDNLAFSPNRASLPNWGISPPYPLAHNIWRQHLDQKVLGSPQLEPLSAPPALPLIKRPPSRPPFIPPTLGSSNARYLSTRTPISECGAAAWVPSQKSSNLTSLSSSVQPSLPYFKTAAFCEGKNPLQRNFGRFLDRSLGYKPF